MTTEDPTKRQLKVIIEVGEDTGDIALASLLSAVATDVSIGKTDGKVVGFDGEDAGMWEITESS